MPPHVETSLVVSRGPYQPRNNRPIRSSSPTRVSVTLPGKRSRRRRKRTRRVVHNASGRAPPNVLAKYIATLSDPFDNPPVNLGWGTMVPTGLGTLFYRAAYTTSTDGSLTVIVIPTVNTFTGGQAPIISTTGVYSANTWTTANWNNNTAYNSLANEARVVSVGLKVLPQVPMTAAPGVVYSGALPGMSVTDILSCSTQQMASSPFLKLGYGNVGAIACGRPEDPTSFSFNTATLLFTSNSTVLPYTCPIIAMSGFPASTSVLVEAVLNIEYLYDHHMMNSQAVGGTTAPSGTGQGSADVAEDTVTASFPNVESMWNVVKRYLPDPGITDSLTNIAERGANAALRAAGNAAFRSLGNRARNLQGDSGLLRGYFGTPD